MPGHPLGRPTIHDSRQLDLERDALKVFRPLSELRCRQCGGDAGPDDDAVRVYAVDGPRVRAYCGPDCARTARQQPWVEAA
ncbi:conserved protein of unknown function (plasmid) [Rhodovastum atsumiense]|nr:conserved protein of unknown function [Rhodovastum atsumiense]